MKKALLFAFAALMMGSCTSIRTYYQVCKVSSDLKVNTEGSYTYSDQACEINYDFWSNGGNICFTVTNNTDEILYVDMSASFVIKNGIAYDYFLNRTTQNSLSMSKSESISGSAAAFGLWNIMGAAKYVPGMAGASKAQNSESRTSASVAFHESKVVAIPPKSSKIFSEYQIMPSRFQDCDLYESPSKNETATMSFNSTTTPVFITNYITYRFGENGVNKVVKNDFFVSTVSNQHEDATIIEMEDGCATDMFRHKYMKFIKWSPSEFYIPYSPRPQKNMKGYKANHSNEFKGYESIYND